MPEIVSCCCKEFSGELQILGLQEFGKINCRTNIKENFLKDMLMKVMKIEIISYFQEPLNFADTIGQCGRQNNALLTTSVSYSLEPVTSYVILQRGLTVQMELKLPIN